MNLQPFLDKFGFIGKYTGIATSKSIQFLSSFGIDISPLQANILNLIIILVLIFVLIKLVETPKKIVKFGIIFLLVLLAISIVTSFFIKV